MRGSGGDEGSIPAWAGETRVIDENKVDGRVYPRVGGGNSALWRQMCEAPGLSPRGRGKPVDLIVSHV